VLFPSWDSGKLPSDIQHGAPSALPATKDLTRGNVIAWAAMERTIGLLLAQFSAVASDEKLAVFREYKA
jgi:hypothetical protein